MSIRAFGGAVAALSLLLAACASTGTDDAATEADLGAAVAEGAVETIEPIDVKAGTSPLGDLLIGPAGLTLYGFTNDIEALSTCYGTCADAWPPVIVDVDWTAGPGLDFGIFATTVREDGQLQLVAGQWPLYYFAGDAQPGDINGQGSGDVWFAVDHDGRLITDAAGQAIAAEEPAASDAPDAAGDEADEAAADTADTADTADAAPAVAGVASAGTDLGEALVDDAGLTLYGFLNDDGRPTCNHACADAWPPVLVDALELPAGLDPGVFTIVERDDGSLQLKAGDWPLYRFAGDAAPGDVNGQGSGDVWFVAAPDGSLIGASGAAADTGGSDSAGEDDESSRDY